jgi:hypothetical protein
LLILLGSPAWATVTANSIISAQTVNRIAANFIQGTDTALTYKIIYTAGANGSRCNSLWMTTNDGTATHLVTVQISKTNTLCNSAATNCVGGTATTTVLSAGFANATPSQNLLSAVNWPGLPLDSDGNPYIQLVSGDFIQATFATALTASTQINLFGSCSDF